MKPYQELQVACPTCEADVGRACRRVESGKPMPGGLTHRDRYKLWVRVERQRARGAQLDAFNAPSSSDPS